MDAATVQALLNTALTQATEQARRGFKETIDDLTRRLSALETPVQVEEYKPIAIRVGVRCSESLDIVKSIPEFSGDATKYMSWRQAAITAHTLYEAFEGSSTYYQAVGIIRNKVVGAADTVLSSYNTVLNFKAILSRLDFSFGDKRSIFTLEQELSTLKQGARGIVEFYDEVEKKLALILNKVIMSNEGKPALIEALSQKYRENALRVFISGLRRPMSDVLFSCRPPDMPSALALAQELETNQTRYNFATTFWNNSVHYPSFNSPHYQPIRQHRFQNNNYIPNSTQYQPIRQQIHQNLFSNNQLGNRYDPPQNLVINRNSNRHGSFHQNVTSRGNNNGNGMYCNNNYRQNAEPMDVDNSNRFSQQQQKRSADSFRQNASKLQRVNHLNQYHSGENYFSNDYEEPPDSSLDFFPPEPQQSYNPEIETQEQNIEDEVNFLELGPSSRT